MSEYDLAAARIEATFAAQHIQARVWEVTVTPRYVRYEVTVGLGVSLSRALKLDRELAFALGVATVRITQGEGRLYVELPRADAKPGLALTGLLRRIQGVPRIATLLGRDEGGLPLLLALDSPDVPHALIAGATGSGKTVLLRTMVVSLALYNAPGHLQLVLIDPKRRGLAPFAPLPHVWLRSGVLSTGNDAERALTLLAQEMERRDQVRSALPQIVIVIDELADLLASSSGARIGELAQRLTQRGREAGIHVLAATQRPAAALVGAMTKANLPARLVGSVGSPEDARVAAGVGGTQAERLHGRGDFLLIARSQAIRFQAAYAPEATLHGLVALAAGTHGRRRDWRDLPEMLPAMLPAPTPVALAVTGVTVSNHVGDPLDAQTGESGASASNRLVTVTNARRLPWQAPTSEDREYLRQLYAQTGSKSEVCRLAYSGKNDRSLAWVNMALAEGVPASG